MTETLSERHKQILGLASNGATDDNIASVLKCSHDQVRYYWMQIFEILDCHSTRPRIQAVAKAIREKQIT